MIPGGLDPKKMQAMMKQMGIDSKEVNAKTVIIETDSGRIVVENPSVTEINVQGQKSFQVSGEVKVEEGPSADDVKMVVEQAGCSEEEAKAALEKSGGDIAEAIVALTEKSE